MRKVSRIYLQFQTERQVLKVFENVLVNLIEVPYRLAGCPFNLTNFSFKSLQRKIRELD